MPEVREFKLGSADHGRLMRAGRAIQRRVPIYPGPEPPTAQERTNEIWRDIGSRMGFEWETVRPAPGKSSMCFVAELRPSPRYPTDEEAAL